MKYFIVQVACRNSWADEDWLQEKLGEVFIRGVKGYGAGFEIIHVKELKTRMVQAVPITQRPVCDECGRRLSKSKRGTYYCLNVKCVNYLPR